jgi:hypothetical protein
MAKSGNTWCKKLMTKGKQYALKQALGNEVGVANYCAKAKSGTARALNRQSVDDKPTPKGPSYPKAGKAPLPRVDGWKPKAFGKRGR